ncbi:hypothetical protein AMST5_00082 [freshwater sediment metagenome]|uniref:Uncharacterized protein n=1 Tax=freshwater sediment metagenome TaxID=556182 RepID=A0AA48RCI7_9ZZZZ
MIDTFAGIIENVYLKSRTHRVNSGVFHTEIQGEPADKYPTNQPFFQKASQARRFSVAIKKSRI